MIDTKEQIEPFNLPIRIYIEDTDAGGIVFYANYLKYFERARTEYIRSLGYELRRSLDENISFVVHSLDIKYLRPARLDDVISATVVLEKLAKSYLVFRQTILSDDGLTLVEARVKVACIYFDTHKPRVLPAKLSEKLMQTK